MGRGTTSTQTTNLSNSTSKAFNSIASDPPGTLSEEVDTKCNSEISLPLVSQRFPSSSIHYDPPHLQCPKIHGTFKLLNNYLIYNAGSKQELGCLPSLILRFLLDRRLKLLQIDLLPPIPQLHLLHSLLTQIHSLSRIDRMHLQLPSILLFLPDLLSIPPLLPSL